MNKHNHLSNVTPMDGGEIVVFCVAIAAVTIDVVMTVEVVRLRDFVVVGIDGDFMILVVVETEVDFIMLDLTSGCFGFESTATFGS